MTPDEFESLYLSAKLRKPTTQARKLRKFHTDKEETQTSALPDYVNWYEAGKVSESVD
jgi:hypothetical protein